MLRSLIRARYSVGVCCPSPGRLFGTAPRRVAIVGASGRVGSTVAMLLKQSKHVDTLVMCDVQTQNCGVAMDISHIDTGVRMMAYTGLKQFVPAFKDCTLVLVCAGVPRNSCAMSPQQLFEVNAPIVQHITECFAESCPRAILGIVTQPINSLVPMASEILKLRGVYDARKVFGVTCVDVMRATTFASELNGLCTPENTIVPVVGGHCEKTIVPVFSQARPCKVRRLSQDNTSLANRLTSKSAGWVVAMKDDKGGPVLGPAYAVARFATSLLKAQRGEHNLNTCAYVRTDTVAGLRYCSLPVELGPDGVKCTALPSMTANEQLCLSRAKCELMKHIELGENYILKSACPSQQQDLLFNSMCTNP